MLFKEALELALQGYKIRKVWWKEGHYITLNNDSFYDENNEVYIIDSYKDRWDTYKDRA